MNELDKNYQKKKDILKDVKDLFYSNKKEFKKNFLNSSISDRANLLAFILVNDSKFYDIFHKYMNGVESLKK